MTGIKHRMSAIEAHLTAIEARLEEQVDIIDDLREYGLPTSRMEELLSSYLHTLETLMSLRDQLEALRLVYE